MIRFPFRCCLLAFAFSLHAVPDADYERKNYTIREGDLITIPLELKVPSERWETRLINADTLSLVSEKTTKQKVELVLKGIAPGLGRLEAVLIRRSQVVSRVYFFIQVERKQTGTDPGKAPVTGNTNDSDGDKGSPGEADFEVARRMLEQGYHAEAARYFRLFRQQYPQSPLVHSAQVYEGQAHFEEKKYSAALAVLQSLPPTAPPEVRQLAALWEANSLDALKRDDQAVSAYLRALTPGGDPEISIRARIGLALHYSSRGKYTLAGMQFNLLFEFEGKQKKEGSGYLLALYYAARMYDLTPVIRDIDKAYTYYRQFLDASLKYLADEKNAAKLGFMNRLRQDAQTRLDYLKANFIDFR